ncbi:MAG: hypothetical protein K2X48_12130 [Chitinophagaceae bacterium]|nr:hypothetical protein [Chitinophagaceae bacterium]
MKLCLVLLIFSLPSFLSAQKSKKNTAYVQLWGNGLIVSANYERQFTNKPGLNAQIGVGLGNYKPTVPIGLNYLFNLKNQKSFIETGFSVVLAEKNLFYNDFVFATPDPILKEYSTGYVPSIGYRYHASKGFMLKIIYSPFFTKLKSNWAYYGIGMGWRF